MGTPQERGQRRLPDTEIRKQLGMTDMIRNRGLDKYASLLRVNFADLVMQTVQRKGSFLWYDMCSGRFNAASGLIDDLYFRSPEARAMIPNLTLVGVDIDTLFADDEKRGYVTLTRGNVADYPLPPDVDLITSYRGLRYVEQYTGLGVEAVEGWYNALPIGGTLAVDLSGNERLESDRLQEAIRGRFGVDAVKWVEDYVIGETALTFNVVKTDEQRLVLPK